MGKKKKNKTPAARLELDKSMRKRMDKPDNAVLGMNMLSYTPPSDFSYVLLPATRLCYSPDENISIDVKAICENFGDSDLKFKWKYTELNSDGSTGKDYENTTKAPYVAISSLNNIANDHRILISVTVEDAGNPVKKVDAGQIIIKPVITPKEITDKVEWFSVQDGVKMKANSELDKMVCSVIELYGYNGEDVTVDRFVTFNGGVIFSNLDKLVVSNNCLLVKFNRSEIAGKAKTGDTVTLNYTIQARTGESSDIIKHDFKLAERTLVKEEAADALQPVVCGPVDIRENNFKQCKYTKIEAEYAKDPKGTEKEKITVFQENDNIEALPINLIGGKRKVDIVLSDYTPEKCRLKEGSHKTSSVIYTSPSGVQRTLQVKVSGKTGEIKDIEVEYDYSAINLLKTLLLPFNGVSQTHRLDVSELNCRHRMHKEIVLNVYPDIKWEAFLELSSSEAALYSHTNMPASYQIFERHQEKALNAAQKVKDIDLSFGLQLECKDGTKTIKYTADIERSVNSVATVIKTIRDALDVISFKKVVDDNRRNLKAKNILPKSSSIPVFIEISTPVLHIGGGWQYDYSSSGKIARKGEVAICASPLIEVKGGLDLIACSQYIPVVGQIIKAILKINDLAEWLTKRISRGKAKYEGLIWFNIYLKGGISIDGTVEFSDENKDIALESPISIVVGIEIGLSAEVKVETISINATAYSAKVGLHAQTETGLTFKPGMGYNSNDGMYLGFEVKFNGITISISGVAKIEKSDKRKKKNFSLGGETSLGPYSLIDEIPIFKGKVYPFKKDN